MSQGLRGYRKSLPKGEPHSFKIQQRLKLLRVKKLCWQKLLEDTEEIKVQSKELKRLSTLLERQQTILEQVQKQQQSSVSQVPSVQSTTSWLNELQREAFDLLLGIINARHLTGIEHLSGLSQNILVTGKAYFEDELAGEATWSSHHPSHVHFASSQKGGLTSTPLKSAVKVGEDKTLLPQQRRARESLMNTTTCPPRHKMWMAMQEFHKMHKPKINKLKGVYSAMANSIFQPWLKDIWVHVEDHNLSEREAMQPIKDFTAEHACNEVKFYMGRVMKDQQTLEASCNTSKMLFSLAKPSVR